MIPYHGYDTTALVHHHHPAYATNNNPVEQEVPKYARWAPSSPAVSRWLTMMTEIVPR